MRSSTRPTTLLLPLPLLPPPPTVSTSSPPPSPSASTASSPPLTSASTDAQLKQQLLGLIKPALPVSPPRILEILMQHTSLSDLLQLSQEPSWDELVHRSAAHLYPALLEASIGSPEHARLRQAGLFGLLVPLLPDPSQCQEVSLAMLPDIPDDMLL